VIRRLFLAALLALALPSAVSAQPTPPSPMPVVPDEPLPEWHPPTRRQLAPIFLTVSPEMVTAQKYRQVGLWISSIGWLQFFAAGILYAAAVDTNDTLSNIRTTGIDVSGNSITDAHFSPALEDKRNNLEKSALSLSIIGGAMAVGGFVVFTIGQSRITIHHKRHPKEPLPPLSGF
jgi:hypothetical protein